MMKKSLATLRRVCSKRPKGLSLRFNARYNRRNGWSDVGIEDSPEMPVEYWREYCKLVYITGNGSA
jgi:hypothetical protein